MKATCLAAAMMLASTCAAGATSSDGCTFDQAQQERALAKLAARHPGGRISRLDRSVTWDLPDGALFVVGQGGCVDLATTVRLQFGRHQDPSIEKALPALVAATRRFLSADYADDIADAWARHALRGSTPARGITAFDVQKDSHAAMPYPLEIELSAKGISADWQEL